MIMNSFGQLYSIVIIWPMTRRSSSVPNLNELNANPRPTPPKPVMNCHVLDIQAPCLLPERVIIYLYALNNIRPKNIDVLYRKLPYKAATDLQEDAHQESPLQELTFRQSISQDELPRPIPPLRNACYMQVILFSLFQLKVIKKSSISSVGLGKCYNQLFDARTLRKFQDFQRILGQNFNDFDNNQQQDALEFYRILIETLRSENSFDTIENYTYRSHSSIMLNFNIYMAKKIIKQPKLILKSVQGYLIQVFFCQNRHQSRHKIQRFTVLHLPIDYHKPKKEYKLSRMIKKYLQPENLDEYLCRQCHSKKMKKKITFITLPQYLFIGINRFGFQGAIFQRKAFRLQCLDHQLLLQENQGKMVNFGLCAIIFHEGTFFCGHYTAICRIQGVWYFYDSQKTPIVSRYEPSQQQLVNLCSNAYIFIYKKLS